MLARIPFFRSLMLVSIAMCITMVITNSVVAQTGPEVPCEGCPDFTSLPLPQTGIWYNPEQSGTGFMLEVQNGRVAGYYFLFADDGEPEWLLLSGQLEESDSSEVVWILETDLKRFQGGACLNCAYDAPMPDASQGQVRFEFLQRNVAQFQVDDGPVQRIRSLAFGVPVSPAARPATDYPVPELQGYWALSLMGDLGWRYSGGFEFLEIDQDPEFGFRVPIARPLVLPDGLVIDPPPPVEIVGELRCGSIGPIEGPVCEIELDELSDDGPFLMPLGNLGPSRFQAESENNRVLHAHRLEFD